MTESMLPARRWLADQIRARVVGPNAAQQHQDILGGEGPRWFDDDSVIRIVHADASMFVGGLRALLLQSLHPLAMAGVAHHSDFRHDPWGRLQRTAQFLAATTFGPAPVAEQAVAVVRRVHQRVQGVASDGRRYSASDPHLLRWVHICEVDSFLVAYRRYGSEQLTDSQADQYVSETAVVARALGVNDPPLTVADLRAEFVEFRPELRGTREARDAARFLLLEPPLPLAARAPYAVLAAAAVAMLPISEKMVLRPAGHAVTQLIRWSLTSAA